MDKKHQENMQIFIDLLKKAQDGHITGAEYKVLLKVSEELEEYTSETFRNKAEELLAKVKTPKVN